MHRKSKIVAGSAVATAVCAGVAVPAFAAASPSAPHSKSAEPAKGGNHAEHKHRTGVAGLPLKQIAKDAGTDVKGLRDGRKAGKSLAEIAASRGVSKATLLSRLDKSADAQVAKLLDAKLPTGKGQGKENGKAGKHPAARKWAKNHGVGGELKTVASTLKLTPAQLIADLKKGQSLSQIATAQHVSKQTLQGAVDKVVNAKIAKAVDAKPKAHAAKGSAQAPAA